MYGPRPGILQARQGGAARDGGVARRPCPAGRGPHAALQEHEAVQMHEPQTSEGAAGQAQSPHERASGPEPRRRCGFAAKGCCHHGHGQGRRPQRTKRAACRAAKPQRNNFSVVRFCAVLLLANTAMALSFGSAWLNVGRPASGRNCTAPVPDPPIRLASQYPQLPSQHPHSPHAPHSSQPRRRLTRRPHLPWPPRSA